MTVEPNVDNARRGGRMMRVIAIARSICGSRLSGFGGCSTFIRGVLGGKARLLEWLAFGDFDALIDGNILLQLDRRRSATRS